MFPRTLTDVRDSFGHAIDGLWHLIRTQRNFRIHLALAVLVALLATLLRFTAQEWAVLALTVALVLALEGLNTGIEIAVTLASPERRPEAKAAKDIAAGMVLLAALAALIVGALLFTPHLQALLSQ